MNRLKDIDVVIRTCGERTTELLVRDVNRLLPCSRLHIVEERPHFKAVLETFSYAKKSTAQFTLALDADLILDERVPELLLSGIERYDLATDLRLHFLVKDKFVGIRDAANHLYNNNFSQQLYEFFVKNAEPNSNRPESDNLSKFSKLHGLKVYKTYLGKRSANKKIPEFIGYHGHEQSYAHIYQGMSNFAVKYMGYKKIMRNRLESLNKKYPQDFDYKIAIKGFLAGSESEEIVSDSEKYADITDLLNSLGIAEKPPLVLT